MTKNPSSSSTSTKPTTVVFTYHDPGRTFDGSPYEAAGMAVIQTSNVIKLLKRSVLDTRVQVRNAWMQRNIDTGQEPRAEDWAGTPEERMFVQFSGAMEAMQRKLSALHRASTYNPKEPPKE